MSDKSKIEWTDATWNPVRGCSRVSPGCENCYAEKFAHRFHAVEGHAFEGLTVLTKRGPRWNGRVKLVHSALDIPKRWKKGRRIFVPSMSDLFHAEVPPHFIHSVLSVMADCPQHTFQLLTKRPKRAREVITDWVYRRESKAFTGTRQFLKNLWLGVSVEDQQRAEERIPVLLGTPAAKHWLSCEPLLGPVSLFGRSECDEFGAGFTYDPGLIVEPCSTPTDYGTGIEYDENAYPGIDWVVVGGESGPGARPCEPEWITSVVEECKAADVPVFFKQWGQLRNNPDKKDPTAKVNGGYVKGGCMLDGHTYHQFPDGGVLS